jgi:hypothetical protein
MDEADWQPMLTGCAKDGQGRMGRIGKPIGFLHVKLEGFSGARPFSERRRSNAEIAQSTAPFFDRSSPMRWGAGSKHGSLSTWVLIFAVWHWRLRVFSGGISKIYLEM